MMKMIEKTREGNANPPPQEPTTNSRYVVKHYFAVGGQASVSVFHFHFHFKNIYPGIQFS